MSRGNNQTLGPGLVCGHQLFPIEDLHSTLLRCGTRGILLIPIFYTSVDWNYNRDKRGYLLATGGEQWRDPTLMWSSQQCSDALSDQAHTFIGQS